MILMRGWKFHTGIQRKKAEDDKNKNTKKSFKPPSAKCMKPNFSFHTRHCVNNLGSHVSTLQAHTPFSFLPSAFMPASCTGFPAR
jgi:hypothetical protein